MTEIEVKIRIPNPKGIREKLLRAGAALSRERHLETNILYDLPDGSLRRSRRALRLRMAGRRATLTFKAEPRGSKSFKVREEFETQVQNPRQARLILKALGFRPSVTYRKHRTVFRKGRLAVCLDETAAGAFLELEGERHEIVRFAQAMGYGRADFLTSDYVELIARAEEEDGRA